MYPSTIIAKETPTLPSMLYNKLFDRNKTLAFNARTVGNLPHNHPVELSNQEDKAIHLIHTKKRSVGETVNHGYRFRTQCFQFRQKKLASCNILVRTLLLIYIYTNEYKAATDLTVSNLLNLLFSFNF